MRSENQIALSNEQEDSQCQGGAEAYLPYTINTMTADDLATQAARASVIMV